MGDTYIRNNECFLKGFLGHFLNFGGHVLRSEVSKETHSDCFGFVNDAKASIESNMSRSFLRINLSRGLENDHTGNRNGTDRVHGGSEGIANISCAFKNVY